MPPLYFRKVVSLFDTLVRIIIMRFYTFFVSLSKALQYTSIQCLAVCSAV